jgi:hypothetical protein
MGIDETLTEDWRDENQIPDTDGIEEMRESESRVKCISSRSCTKVAAAVTCVILSMSVDCFQFTQCLAQCFALA